MIKDKKKEVQRDVDMMSTTVGGTTVQGSTGDVPEGESSDDGLEKLTHRSDSPRLTNSSGRKQRRPERFLEYAETNVVVAGWTFEIVDVDQRKKARTAVEGSVLDGLDSSQKIGEIILSAEAEKYSLEELTDQKAKMDSFFMGTFVPCPTKKKSVTFAHNLVMRWKEAPWGGTSWWCHLCGQWGSDDHTNSKEHSTKVHELASCNEMIGVALRMRRFEKEAGLRGMLSKRRFRDFWGNEVEFKMGDILRDRLSKDAVVKIIHTKVRTSTITKDNIEALGMHAVTYGGCGKYSKQDVEERAIRWDDIEDDGETLIREPLPPKSGWWPALSIFWKGMAEEHGYSKIEYFQHVVAGVLPIYVLCLYQLVDGTCELQAWPIRICSRL